MADRDVARRHTAGRGRRPLDGRLPVVLAEIKMSGTRRDDQVIEREIRLVRQDHGATLTVDRHDVFHHDTHVALGSQRGAQRRSDVCRRERGSRDLIEERLKHMMVGAIDQCDRDLGPTEFLRRS